MADTRLNHIKNGLVVPKLVDPADHTSEATIADLVAAASTYSAPETVSGDISDNTGAVLRSLLDALATMGIIDDQTTD